MSLCFYEPSFKIEELICVLDISKRIINIFMAAKNRKELKTISSIKKHVLYLGKQIIRSNAVKSLKAIIHSLSRMHRGYLEARWSVSLLKTSFLT